jgi:hypothetical protein
MVEELMWIDLEDVVSLSDVNWLHFLLSILGDPVFILFVPKVHGQPKPAETTNIGRAAMLSPHAVPICSCVACSIFSLLEHMCFSTTATGINLLLQIWNKANDKK